MDISYAERLIVYVFSLGLLFVFDLIWLGWVMSAFYARQFKGIFAKEMNQFAAVGYYLVFNLGLMYFAICPAIREQSLSKAMISGALYGLIVYTAHNLINLSTLKKWPKKVVVVEVLWGTLLCFAVSVISYNFYIGLF